MIVNAGADQQLMWEALVAAPESCRGRLQQNTKLPEHQPTMEKDEPHLSVFHHFD